MVATAIPMAVAKAQRTHEYFVDSWHDVRAPHHHGRIRCGAQRRVQHGALLRRVEDLACLHASDLRSHALLVE